jgi:arylsulfatase A-like enzyme
MRFPANLGIPPQRVAAPVQNLDIYPTVLGTLGIPIPRHLFGENLLPLEELAALERVVFSDREPLVMLRSREHGLLVDYDQGNLSFFDLTTDPGELTPLADYREDQAFLQLRGIFDQWYERYLARAAIQEGGDGAQMSEELLESLKSLGYVE